MQYGDPAHSNFDLPYVHSVRSRPFDGDLGANMKILQALKTTIVNSRNLWMKREKNQLLEKNPLRL